MSFHSPTFNLTCNIWNAPNAPPAAPDGADVPCQLYFPRQDQLEVTPGVNDTWRGPMYIRLPKLTDVRFADPADGLVNQIECPAGSGRFYGVCYVDDAHKGFVNEYRIAVVQWLSLPPFPLP